jgi:hypothetical protein
MWVWTNKFLSEYSADDNLDCVLPMQAADLRALVEEDSEHLSDDERPRGWVARKKVNGPLANLPYLVGDGFFYDLKQVSRAIVVGDTPEHETARGYRLTPHVAATMLMGGQCPNEIFKRAQWGKVAGTPAAADMLGSYLRAKQPFSNWPIQAQLDPSPASLEIDLKGTGLDVPSSIGAIAGELSKWRLRNFVPLSPDEVLNSIREFKDAVADIAVGQWNIRVLRLRTANENERVRVVAREWGRPAA